MTKPNLTDAERARLRHDLERAVDAAVQRAGLDPASEQVKAVRARYGLDVNEEGRVGARLDLPADHPAEALAARIVAEADPDGEGRKPRKNYEEIRARVRKKYNPDRDAAWERRAEAVFKGRK